MRIATKSDRKLVVDTIAESFDKNPSVNWVIKNDAKIIRVFTNVAIRLIRQRGKRRNE